MSLENGVLTVTRGARIYEVKLGEAAGSRAGSQSQCPDGSKELLPVEIIVHKETGEPVCYYA